MRVVNTKKRYLFINPSTHKIRLNNGAQRLKNQRAYIKVTDALRDDVRTLLGHRLHTITHNYKLYAVTCSFADFLDGYGLTLSTFKKYKTWTL